MAEKRYFWLKLYEDFFTSKRIKKLRSIAGGDTYTIIYLKMQLKALKTDGYLYFDGVMSDFAEELALDIDEKPDDVKVAINYLMSVGLLETNDGEQYKLPFLDRCIGSETASAQRLRDYRARKKDTKALHCNASVTEVKQVGNAEKEIDIEIDIEMKKVKEIVASQIGLSDLYKCTDIRPERINTVYEVICKVLRSNADTLKINSEILPMSKVQEVYRKLDYEDIEYVCAVLGDPKPKAIVNIESYIRTLLYNAKSMRDEYWSQKVNHDLTVDRFNNLREQG